MDVKSDRLSRIFSALSDPTRRGILALLAAGEKTVSELVDAFNLSQPAISKHLKVLEESGLIERTQKAQWRPAKLQAEPLKEASAWVDQYRQHWEDSFDRLGEYLGRVQDPAGADQRKEGDERPQPQRPEESNWKMF